MGDQQQKIDALRAAMTRIQERDPDEPVPDFLVVDTSLPAPPADAPPADPPPADAGTAGSAPGETVPGDALGAEADSAGPELADSELAGPELADIESGDLEFEASAAARPLVDPGGLPGPTAPLEAEDRREDRAEDAPAFDAPEVNAPEVDAPEAEAEAEADDGEAETSMGAIAELSPEEQYEKARAVVLRRLTGSPKSRHQLAVALKEKEFHPEIITRVLDRMEEVHLVNDTEFARTWVRGRHELKNLGKSALRRELREKGISEPVAADALEQISAEDEGEAARELVRRKLQGKAVPTGPSPEERAERDKVTRRLVSMLARRGHAPGAAFQIVREVIEDHSNA
ncbi:regulatory protein RecX [Nesterenkonia sp. AY15]|uniref:regulatory protein RecX n=1 Tax=Nesterenkonia sp. AY15 TaxID=2901139 RepID=UPI003144DD44